MNITWADKQNGANDATGTVTGADMNEIKRALNPNEISFTQSIPFTRPVTIVAPHTVVADLVLIPVTAGAVPGNGAYLRLKADGVHTVDLSAFKLMGTEEWDNTNNVVNQLIFMYDGVAYCVAISHPAAIAPPPVNVAPTVSSVAFTGTQTQGQTLTGAYVYADADSDAEGTSLKQWYRSDDGSGTNLAAISGATNSTYVLQSGDVGKYIQFAVTPVAATGTTTGIQVFSAYSGAIVALGALVSVSFVGTDVSTVSGQTSTSSTNTNYNHPARGSVSLPAATDGYIQAEFVSGHGDVVLQLSESNVSSTWTVTTNLIGFVLDGTNGDIYAIQSGAFVTSPSPLPLIGNVTNGQLVAIFRVGTALLIKKYNGTTWSTLFTSTNTSAARLYASTDHKGVVTAIIDNVQASAFAPIFTELFTGGNRADLSGKVTTTGTLSWGNVASGPGAGNAVKIASGVAKATSSTSFTEYCVVDAGQHDIDATYTIGSAISTGAWAIVALTNKDNLAEVNLQTGEVYQIQGGSPTQLVAGSFTAAAGDTVRVIVSGTSLKVYRNNSGIAASSVTLHSSLTGTKAGLFFYNDGTSAVASISAH